MLNRDGNALNGKAFLGKGWAFPAQADANGNLALVAYEQDIHQAILIILGTAQGERVMRPDFGAGLYTLVFEPLNTTTMARARDLVREALIAWEPRINVESVDVSIDDVERNLLLIEVNYQVRLTNTFYNLVYPFYVMESGQS